MWLAKDSWFGVDKIHHTAYGALLWAFLSAHMEEVPLMVILFASLAILWEVIELIRYDAWDGSPPWPPVTDLFSYKDLVYDALGAFLAALLL